MPCQEGQLITADISGEVRTWHIASLTMAQARTLRKQPHHPSSLCRSYAAFPLLPHLHVQLLFSKEFDRRLNPLRSIVVLGPSLETPDLPWTIFIAGKTVEMWQKARVRQKDTIVSSFFNPKFKNFVIVGARRIYLWDAYTGALVKTYDSTLPEAPLGVMGEEANGRSSSDLAAHQLLKGTREITACCLADEGNSIIIGDEKV